MPRDRYSLMMSFCVVPCSFFRAHALLIGQRDIEREQPGGGGVDRHRRVHRVERDAVEQHAHVAEMRDRHADLADLALGERMVAVVAGLRRQIEGDGQTGLPLAQVFPIKRVRRRRGRMSRVGAENPRFLFFVVFVGRPVAHRCCTFVKDASVIPILLRCNIKPVIAAEPR